MKRFISALGVASALLLPVTVDAATFTITDMSSKWTSWKGGKDAVTVSSEESPAKDRATLTWGIPYYTKKSAYHFVENAPLAQYNTDTNVDIGRFSHLNYALKDDSSISQAVLEVTFSFYIGNAHENIYTATSTFVFDHLETPNAPTDTGNICANGETNKVIGEVNSNGCADRVTARTDIAKSQIFTIVEDGVTRNYAFDIIGFKDIGDAFWTVENRSNSATLQARLTYAENIAAIPLPAAGWLLMAGISGMAALGRFGRGADCLSSRS